MAALRAGPSTRYLTDTRVLRGACGALTGHLLRCSSAPHRTTSSTVFWRCYFGSAIARSGSGRSDAEGRFVLETDAEYTTTAGALTSAAAGPFGATQNFGTSVPKAVQYFGLLLYFVTGVLRTSVSAMRLLAALAVACTVVPAIAPTGEPTSAVLRRVKWPTTKCAAAAPAIPVGATMNVAAAIAAGAMLAASGAVCSSGRRPHGTRERDLGSSSSAAPRPGHVDHVIECSSESESSEGWKSSACVLDSGDESHEVEVDLHVASRKKKASTGKLWSNAQFPEGHVDAANWDLKNLEAAQAWSCPCVDRRNCIGQYRVSIIDLYEHRKAFRTTAAAHGGFRDAARKDLEAHYNDDTRQFMRSFKVGAHTDCCAASSGLAKGILFATWSAARADCKKKRPLQMKAASALAKLRSRTSVHT